MALINVKLLFLHNLQLLAIDPLVQDDCSLTVTTFYTSSNNGENTHRLGCCLKLFEIICLIVFTFVVVPCKRLVAILLKSN